MKDDSSEALVTTFELETDRAPEAIRVQRVPGLPGVELWSVTESRRCWTFLPDAYGACLTLGPAGKRVGSYWSRGEERPLIAGTIRFFEPGEVHRTLEVTEPVSSLLSWWTEDALTRTTGTAAALGRFGWRHAEIDDASLAGALVRLAAHLDHSEVACARLEFEDFTRLLAQEAGETTPVRRRPARYHPAAWRAAEHLEGRFRELVSLEELGQVSGLSKFHLLRCFRAATGLPPHRYQKLLRIREARRLLERGHSVEEAASSSGFADGPHLSRGFRQWLGVTPGAWGRAYRASDASAWHTLKSTPPPALDGSTTRRTG